MFEQKLFTGGDVLAVAKQLDEALTRVDDPEAYEFAVLSSLDMMNRDPAAVAIAGSRKVIVHADEAFTIDPDNPEPDEVEFQVGGYRDIYCSGELRKIMWVGSLNVTGFVACLYGVKVLEAGEQNPRPLNDPLTLPVRGIRHYLLAA